MNQLLNSFIEKNEKRFLDELKTLLRFASVSAVESHKGDVRACAAWLANHFRGLGLRAELVEMGGHPIVKAWTELGRAKRVLIYGHYDVQPEGARDLWRTDPYEPVVQDGVLYGRGTTDDKAQLFAHVKAVEGLLAGAGLPCDVTFLLEGEEECGAESLTAYIEKHAGQLSCDAVVISDTCLYDEETPAITYGLRGLAGFEVTVTGASCEVHSGIYGGTIANPAVVLARLISECVDEEGKVRIPGFYAAVRELESWEKASFAKLQSDDQAWMAELGVRQAFGEAGYSTLERRWVRPTFEVNGMRGGYTGQGSKTVIPAIASAKITMRLVPNQDWQTIVKAAQDYLRSRCPDTVGLSFSGTFGAPPCLVDTQHKWMQAAAAALQEGFGREAVFIREGGSIPIVQTFTEYLKAPVILMGFGLNSNGAHSPNECFQLKHFYKGIAAAGAFLQRLT